MHNKNNNCAFGSNYNHGDCRVTPSDIRDCTRTLKECSGIFRCGTFRNFPKLSCYFLNPKKKNQSEQSFKNKVLYAGSVVAYNNLNRVH